MMVHGFVSGANFSASTVKSVYTIHRCAARRMKCITMSTSSFTSS